MLVQYDDRGAIREEHRVCSSFHEVVDLGSKAEVVAVDIPIGLLEEPITGGRECDKEARLMLGTPRRSSVFTPPTRAALASATWRQHEAWGVLGGVAQRQR